MIDESKSDPLLVFGLRLRVCVWIRKMATLNVPPVPPSPRDDAIALYTAFKGPTPFSLMAFFSFSHVMLHNLTLIHSITIRSINYACMLITQTINEQIISFQIQITCVDSFLQDLDVTLALSSIYLLIGMPRSVPTSNMNSGQCIPRTFSNAYLLSFLANWRYFYSYGFHST